METQLFPLYLVVPFNINNYNQMFPLTWDQSDIDGMSLSLLQN